jgi:poly(A) polymerase
MWRERSRSGPVLAGDVTEEGTVAGFGYVPSRRRPKAECDRLLLTGEECLAEPPGRPVPDDAGSVRALAATPVARVAPDRVHQAKSLDGALPDIVSETLARPGSAWGAVAGPLVSEVHEARHLLWLTGGFARDVIAGRAAEVNDLDLTGTAPPGRFTELARKTRRRSGLEFRTKVSPHSLVCSAQPPLSDERLYEYRTLNSAEFGFQACGSDLEADARCRDFTVNSLYYDPVENVVVDPTGQGLEDLRARPRRLTSLKVTENPLDQARIVLRTVKFAVRWEETTGYELGGAALSLARMPATVWGGLTPQEWELLSGDHHRALGGHDAGRQMSVATALGPGAAGLFATLLEVRP